MVEGILFNQNQTTEKIEYTKEFVKVCDIYQSQIFYKINCFIIETYPHWKFMWDVSYNIETNLFYLFLWRDPTIINSKEPAFIALDLHNNFENLKLCMSIKNLYNINGYDPLHSCRDFNPSVLLKIHDYENPELLIKIEIQNIVSSVVFPFTVPNILMNPFMIKKWEDFNSVP